MAKCLKANVKQIKICSEPKIKVMVERLYKMKVIKLKCKNLRIIMNVCRFRNIVSNIVLFSTKESIRDIPCSACEF